MNNPYDENEVDRDTGVAFDMLSPEKRREFYINAHRLARRFEYDAACWNMAIEKGMIRDSEDGVKLVKTEVLIKSGLAGPQR